MEGDAASCFKVQISSEYLLNFSLREYVQENAVLEVRIVSEGASFQNVAKQVNDLILHFQRGSTICEMRELRLYIVGGRSETAEEDMRIALGGGLFSRCRPLENEAPYRYLFSKHPAQEDQKLRLDVIPILSRSPKVSMWARDRPFLALFTRVVDKGLVEMSIFLCQRMDSLVDIVRSKCPKEVEQELTLHLSAVFVETDCVSGTSG